MSPVGTRRGFPIRPPDPHCLTSSPVPARPMPPLSFFARTSTARVRTCSAQAPRKLRTCSAYERVPRGSPPGAAAPPPPRTSDRASAHDLRITDPLIHTG
eukprot:6194931-Pleurochrysis_carterae.AAC.2